MRPKAGAGARPGGLVALPRINAKGGPAGTVRGVWAQAGGRRRLASERIAYSAASTHRPVSACALQVLPVPAGVCGEAGCPSGAGPDPAALARVQGVRGRSAAPYLGRSLQLLFRSPCSSLLSCHRACLTVHWLENRHAGAPPLTPQCTAKILNAPPPPDRRQSGDPRGAAARGRRGRPGRGVLEAAGPPVLRPQRAQVGVGNAKRGRGRARGRTGFSRKMWEWELEGLRARLGSPQRGGIPAAAGRGKPTESGARCTAPPPQRAQRARAQERGAVGRPRPARALPVCAAARQPPQPV